MPLGYLINVSSVFLSLLTNNYISKPCSWTLKAWKPQNAIELVSCTFITFSRPSCWAPRRVYQNDTESIKLANLHKFECDSDSNLFAFSSPMRRCSSSCLSDEIDSASSAKEKLFRESSFNLFDGFHEWTGMFSGWRSMMSSDSSLNYSMRLRLELFIVVILPLGVVDSDSNLFRVLAFKWFSSRCSTIHVHASSRERNSPNDPRSRLLIHDDSSCGERLVCSRHFKRW